MKRVLVTGAGGFIGHHLVSCLKGKGYWVRGVDIENPEFETSKADEFLILDLRRLKRERHYSELPSRRISMNSDTFSLPEVVKRKFRVL
jgi:nucleoside-diphosphate-sugar epimerase